MARRSTSRAGEVRARVAEEAARIMREQGVRDFLLAKRKAADRLSVIDRHALPTNQEIAAALAAQQRLFEGAGHEENLRALREEAVRVMRLLERFSPRLVGPVLAGTATPHSDISVHLFADAPEQVALMLLERGIRYQEGERRLRLGQGEHAYYPSFEFDLGGAAVDAVVFPERAVRQPPVCPVSGGPMRRARRDELERLLDE
jgi:hypothetical protein